MNFNKKFALGLMSGTSLDGVDIVYVSFDMKDNYAFEIISAKTYSYSHIWKSRLKNAFNQSEKEINFLNIEYGVYLGNLINSFILEYEIEKVDFIASHGHTIFHKPDQGFTLQIGDGSTISKLTKQQVVCNFRTQDVALGGQGAPLVPIGDHFLFSDYNYCLNLGGFANISFEKKGERIAFDICPVNIVLNHYAQKLGFDYDKSGVLASEGCVNNSLLTDLNCLTFYSDEKPKSLGFEFIIQQIFPIIDNYNVSEKDILRTFVAHIAIQVSSKIKKKGNVLITGGGAFNHFLIECIKKEVLGSVIIPNNQIVDFKEALVFAFLGLLRIDNQVNCLSSVTGAKKDHSGGFIYNSY